ncbi:MAG: 16S rRNA (adenine(1518)-N(6)/adenine(1519)-N(6))-dimethyltransferase RsmA [bacterium]|nr:16S rRNA (adenine(1518)-N(6)/adenine(1519)-N(6))-dimethyltransferase RsmA [bacterium]
MDLLEQTKQLCRLYNIKPARSKGQNFLIEEEIYDDIAAAADLQTDDIVLEVGPGLGFLTAKLAARVKKVMAVELDDKLAETLKARLQAQGTDNVEIINEDVLETPLTPLLKGGFKIVANLPYNITSIFLRKFLEAENKPELMVLMLQKEVAERICADAGSMSLLAVSVQFYAKPEIVEIVKKENFWPRPEVDSAIIKLEVRSKKLEENEKDFFRLVKFGFSAKRKMLKNNLAAGFKVEVKLAEELLKSAGFQPKIRAQELSVADWLKLFSAFSRKML